ncbi:unnamed protein product [Calicophoron daubneyi]|uniref:BPTI/Kunitz inhibitor domain-containing protein n=1 Tax=Calicophoron daubneyi TaxID=300641 RepID=A0AAV2T150_CALDB
MLSVILALLISLSLTQSSPAFYEERYRCILTRDRGPCHENIVYWGWSVDDDKCVSYNYGGCGGTENKFVTRQECEEVCNWKAA